MPPPSCTIDRAEVLPFAVPLRRPFEWAGGSVRERTGVLLRLGAGEISGWGEAAPLPGFSRETASDAVDVLAAEIRMLDGEPLDLSAPVRWMAERSASRALPPSVRFALESAALDLGRRMATPPARRVDVSVAALVHGAGEAVRARRNGFRTLKMKVGRHAPVEDARRVLDVVAVAGPDTAVRLDANRAWTFDEAAAFASALGPWRPAFIEEPLADPDRLAELAAEHRLPVALDETLSRTDPGRIAPFDGLAAVVLKPTLLGGIERSLRIARLFSDLGVAAVVSSAIETGVGLYALAALAAELPGPSLAAGIGTAAWLTRNLARPAFPSDRPWVSAFTRFEVDLPGGRR